MADVIRDDVGAQPHRRRHRPKYEAQEPGGGEPDIKRPPDQDLPDVDEGLPETPNGPGVPPFTGEDVEDVGRPKKRDRPTPM
jgi:hypothetical protein